MLELQFKISNLIKITIIHEKYTYFQLINPKKYINKYKIFPKTY